MPRFPSHPVASLCCAALLAGALAGCPENPTTTVDAAADAAARDRLGPIPDADLPDTAQPDTAPTDLSRVDLAAPDSTGGPDSADRDAGPGNIIRVGPTRQYTAPCAVTGIVQPGDTIEIDAAEYVEDVCAWDTDNLTLRGVGGYAHLNANGTGAQGKGIWVIKGDDNVIESIEFSNAAVNDRNGAGIRQEGTNLTVRHCYFHDNENGILTGDDDQSEILIEYSIFEHNGYGDGQTHNMYINHVKMFTLRHCWTHHAVIGHDVKSRAYENHILYNRIVDQGDGTASYQIDLPNGGLSFVIGNVIQQGPNTDNSSIISYGREGLSNPSSELYLINNTIVNDRHTCTFVNFQGGSTVTSINNLFIGDGTLYSDTVTETSNHAVSDGCVADRSGYNFHLDPGCSSAIDQGSAPGSAHGVDLTPVWQYLHPADREARSAVNGTLDIGAFEHGL
jgi:hypothetical protein